MISIQRRGITAYPGLYFLGLPWLHTQKSGFIFRVGRDAAHIAADNACPDPEEDQAPSMEACNR
jgi:putative flavoprotein involved in K+ transport